MKTERGFTLVEVVIIIGLGSIITLGAMLTIQQVLQNTKINNSRVTALDDINRVVIQLKRDIQSHQTANLTDLDVGPTTFEWTNMSGFESEDERDHYSTYSLNGTILYRDSDNTTEILGRHIESLVFTENGEEVDVAITAVSSISPYKSKTLTFSIYRRTEVVDE